MLRIEEISFTEETLLKLSVAIFLFQILKERKEVR